MAHKEVRQAKESAEARRGNQLPLEKYLDSLPLADRQQVAEFVDRVGSEISEMTGERTGIIAFGSSTRPVEMRYGPVEDIDIRILTSAEPGSKKQRKAVGSAVSVVKAYVESTGQEYEYIAEYTEHMQTVEMETYDQLTGESIKRIGPFFLDYDNDDPSFIISPQNDEGLPLHISISGFGSDALESHLKEERKQKQYFAILGEFIPYSNPADTT